MLPTTFHIRKNFTQTPRWRQTVATTLSCIKHKFDNSCHSQLDSLSCTALTHTSLDRFDSSLSLSALFLATSLSFYVTLTPSQ